MTGIHRRIKAVFYGEVLINIVTIVMLYLTGDFFVESFGVAPETPLVIETFRWFGALMVVITYILAQALRSGNDGALRFVLEGYLIGDFVYMAAIAGFVNAAGTGWTASAIFAVVITIILIVSRVIYLWSDYQERQVA